MAIPTRTLLSVAHLTLASHGVKQSSPNRKHYKHGYAAKDEPKPHHMPTKAAKLTRSYPTAKQKHPISSWFGGSHATPRPSVFRQWLCGFTSVEYSLPLNSRDVVVDQGQKRLEIAGMGLAFLYSAN